MLNFWDATLVQLHECLRARAQSANPLARLELVYRYNYMVEEWMERMIVRVKEVAADASPDTVVHINIMRR